MTVVGGFAALARETRWRHGMVDRRHGLSSDGFGYLVLMAAGWLIGIDGCWLDSVLQADLGLWNWPRAWVILEVDDDVGHGICWVLISGW